MTNECTADQVIVSIRQLLAAAGLLVKRGDAIHASSCATRVRNYFGCDCDSRNKSAPRFVALEKDGSVNIYDNDFHWDGMLKVTGDFESRKERARYATAIAKALSDAGDAIPSKPVDCATGDT